MSRDYTKRHLKRQNRSASRHVVGDGEPENWKDIPGYEGFYQVSDLGRVRSLDRQVVYSDGRVGLFKGRIKKLILDGDGYCFVGLCKNGTDTHVPVHQLVLEVFVGPNPSKEVRHFPDNDSTNNRLTNLVWGTRQENTEDRKIAGTWGKLTENEVRVIKSLLYRVSDVDLAKRYRVTPKTITNIRTGYTWGHL